MSKDNRKNIIINNNKAFSLIELSIVLIIIGLLVAGVTGGKSLIESAKTRALMNEIRGYKQAVNTYYAAHDRLPGDPNRTGYFPESWGRNVTSLPVGDFESIDDGYDKDDVFSYALTLAELGKDGIIEYRLPGLLDNEYYDELLKSNMIKILAIDIVQIKKILG